MAFEALVPLPGSSKVLPVGATIDGSLNEQDVMSVTVILARKAALTEAALIRPMEREVFGATYGADPAHVALVEQFAFSKGLTVVESSLAKRRVILNGTVKAMQAAFKVHLHSYKNSTTGHRFRGRSGTISIASELQGAVLGVLGLDNRVVAHAHFRMEKKKKKKPAAPPTTFNPPQVAALYGFPSGVTGAGQTVGIIELGGGFSPTDLATYFKSLGVKAPTVTAVSVDGGANTPGGDADGEVMLDIEVVGSIAPGANIAVYFAPNTDQGFIDAITDAAHDTARKVSIISISWGGPEDSWTAQSQTAMNAALQDAAALGVTVTIAAGDNGSTDGEAGALHVDFPCSSPYALACGGTKLAGSGSTITSEVIWNETAANEGATGGGVSAVFALPTYQQSAGVPALSTNNFAGRGVPDVAGNADPVTGYNILVDGKSEVVGGTSAVAPLWAALVALLNEQLGTNLGFLNPKIYALGDSVFHDITSGNNDDGGLGYYSAGPGWDACSGLGSPDAAALLSALSSSATSSARSGK
jgi:kumamolisin